MAALRVLSLGLALVACAPPIVPIDAPGPHVIATRGPDGARVARWWDSSEPLVSVPGDAQIAIVGPFPSPRSAPSWTSLEPTTLGLSFEGEAPPPGSCGRCDFGGLGALGPGDRCAIPSEVPRRGFTLSGRDLVESGDGEPLIGELRLDASGPCRSPPPEPPTSADRRLLLPTLDRDPVTSFTQADDGTVAVLATERWFVVAADGTRTEWEARGRGSVWWMPETRPARFLVSTVERDLFELRSGLDEPIFLESEVSAVSPARALVDGAWYLFVLRRATFESRPTAMKCQTTPWSCVEEALPECHLTKITASFRRGEELWGIRGGGEAIIRDARGAWRCGPRVFAALPPGYELLTAHELGDDKVALASTNTARSRVDHIEVVRGADETRVLGSIEIPRRVHITNVVSRSDQLHLLTDVFEVALEIEPDGRLTRTERPDLGLGRPILNFHGARTSTTYSAFDGALIRRGPSGDALLDGPPTPIPEAPLAIGARGEELLVVDAAGDVARFSAQGDPNGAERISGLEAGERVIRLAPLDLGFWALTERDGVTRIRRIRPDLSAEAADAFPIDRVSELVAGPEGFVFAVAERRLWAWSAATGALEVGPEEVRALVSIDGIAVAACDGVILRVSVLDGAPRIERLDLEVLVAEREDRKRIAAPLALGVFASTAGELNALIYERSENTADLIYELSSLRLRADERAAWIPTVSSLFLGGTNAPLHDHYLTESMILRSDGEFWVGKLGQGTAFAGVDRVATIRTSPWARLVVSGQFGRVSLLRPGRSP